MIDLRPVFNEHHAAGPLHALVSIDAVVSEQVLATKSGGLVAVLALRGMDPECLDPAQIDTLARRFESVVRIFDERFRIYQYWIKREHPGLSAESHADPVVDEATRGRLHYLTTKAGPLYAVDTYVAVVLEDWRPAQNLGSRFTRWFMEPGKALRQSLSAQQTIEDLTKELAMAQELLLNKVNSFVIQLRDVLAIEVLSASSAFQFLRRLLNYTPEKADVVSLKSKSFLDYQACSSSLECHRDFLRLDEHYVDVLTLKEPPAHTFANMLRGLIDIQAACVMVSEWKRENPEKVRALIRSKRRHFHNSKSSLGTHLSSGAAAGPQDRLVDNGAVAVIDDLGGCLEEIEMRGRSFGLFSLTLVLYDRELAALRRAVAHCFKVFATHDAQLTEERYNRLNAWLAVLPGNAAYNLRRLWFLDANYADLSFLYTPDGGAPRNEHLAAEYLAVLEGRGGVPYFLNLHHNDLAHTLVLGATGSGKSFLLNFLLTHLQKYGPLTYIFDLGGSYESLTRLFGGSYLPVGLEKRPFTINPFCLPPTPENLLFLFAWVRVLIESNGYRMRAEEEQDLYEQIETLYQIAPDQRRLLTLANILQRNLRMQLQKWVEGGPFGPLFDHAEDTLTLSRFQTFDFEGMDRAKDQLEPLLFYVLHRANTAIQDADRPTQFKVFVMDEAWRFFRHPVIKAYIVEALKTWRKKNAAMVLATQSSDDLMASDMLPVVVESCPTKIFLANPGMDRESYRRAFHLSETETELVARLVPKQELMLKRPDKSKILRLNVDKEYWIYTNHPPDNERKRRAFARYGFREGLEALARGNA